MLELNVLRLHTYFLLAMFLIGCIVAVPTVAHAEVPNSKDGQWAKYPGNPILTPTPGSWDADYDVGPRVLYDGRIFRMWFNGGNTATGISGIGYATSNDGFVWTKYAARVFTPGPPGAWDSGEVELGSVIWNGTLFLMWYRGSNTTSVDTGAIGLATSTNGTSWIRYDRNPILTTGQFGLDLATPYSINLSPRSYDMWYTGETADEPRNSSASQLLYATSLDGVEWAKWPGPVLSPSANPSTWDSGLIYSPSVFYDGTNFELWYTGMNASDVMPQIGFATSPDGANWTRSPSNPVLGPGSPGSWDSAGVEQPNAVSDGNGYLLYYDGFGTNTGGRIGVAQNSRLITVPEFPLSPYGFLSALVLCAALCLIRRARVSSKQLFQCDRTMGHGGIQNSTSPTPTV